MVVMKEEATSPPVSSATPSPLHHFSLMPISSPSGAYPFLAGELSSADRGLLLIHLLVGCAAHVAARNLEAANAALERISALAAPDGDAMQRMASYFTDALARRLLRSLPGVYRALHRARPSPAADAHLARRRFLELCPFLRLALALANNAIADAMRGERVVHVVDLHAWDPSQWVALLHVLSSRPEGPPHLRVTGVHELKEVLDHVGARLSDEAERLDVPFQFHPVIAKIESLDVEMLRVKTGEALAVSSILQLHQLLVPEKEITGSGSGSSPIMSSSPPTALNGLLASLRSLSPKILVVAEQESDHNRAALGERFAEAMNYYAALFDCMESTLPRASPERARVERLLLGEEIRNVIACEGAERTERHERLERWVQRLGDAGFAKVPLGYDAMYQARALLQSWRCEGYRVREEGGEGGAVFLCWQSHPLFTVSAWRCRSRFDLE